MLTSGTSAQENLGTILTHPRPPSRGDKPAPAFLTEALETPLCSVHPKSWDDPNDTATAPPAHRSPRAHRNVSTPKLLHLHGHTGPASFMSATPPTGKGHRDNRSAVTQKESELMRTSLRKKDIVP